MSAGMSCAIEGEGGRCLNCEARAYPALAAEVRALREELANRAVEAFALRGVAAAARCAVLSENLSRDDLRRELDMLRAALAKVPR